MKNVYNLDFIEQELLFKHIKETILKYSNSLKLMGLKEFNSNIIDPIKLLFYFLVFNIEIETVINSEILRQKDKTNNNIIGYFHQNIFKYIKNKEWEVPSMGFDIVNENAKIFVEMKNKHNTMNSSSSQKTYMNMLKKLVDYPDAECYLVEVIAKQSQNKSWNLKVNGIQHKNEKIRRISIDKFYKIVTSDNLAFYKLCNSLPIIIKGVPETLKSEININKDTVIQEFLLIAEDQNIIDFLFKTSFSTYQGWNKKQD